MPNGGLHNPIGLPQHQPAQQASDQNVVPGPSMGSLDHMLTPLDWARHDLRLLLPHRFSTDQLGILLEIYSALCALQREHCYCCAQHIHIYSRQNHNPWCTLGTRDGFGKPLHLQSLKNPRPDGTAPIARTTSGGRYIESGNCSVPFP